MAADGLVELVENGPGREQVPLPKPLIVQCRTLAMTP